MCVLYILIYHASEINIEKLSPSLPVIIVAFYIYNAIIIFFSVLFFFLSPK